MTKILFTLWVPPAFLRREREPRSDREPLIRDERMKMPCTRGFKLVTPGLSGLMLVVLMPGTFIGALAQSISGALHGTVTDLSGAVIPGAMIEVRNLGNAQVRTATTDRRGYYAVADLAPGQY